MILSRDHSYHFKGVERYYEWPTKFNLLQLNLFYFSNALISKQIIADNITTFIKFYSLFF